MFFVGNMEIIRYMINVIIDNCHHPLWCKRLGQTASLITLNDYILNIICFVLFIRTLRRLIVAKLSSDVYEYMDDSQESVETNDILEAMGNTNNGLLTLMTKQCVIGTFIIIANQAFATCIFWILTFGDKDEEESRMLMIAYLIRAVEGAFISCLLYLGLGINHKEYRIFCKYCHLSCYNLCVKSTKNKVKKSFGLTNNDYALMTN